MRAKDYSRNSADGTIHWHSCPSCGKRSYIDRRTAKRVAKRHQGHLNTYECDSGGWHIGHLPRAVMQGKVAAGQYYGRTTGLDVA